MITKGAAKHVPEGLVGRTPGADAEIERRLHEAGLKVTRPRLLVYGVLRDAGGHRSVDDVVKILGRQGHRVPRMSVYNVMADLTAAHILMRADTGPGLSLYEASDTWHHHFVCRTCGAIEDVPCVVGKKPCLEPSAGLEAVVDEAQVIFRGVCGACRRREGARAEPEGLPKR